MKISADISKQASRPVDLLGVGFFEGGKDYKNEIADSSFTGKNGESFFIPGAADAKKGVLLIGLGKEDKYTLDRARRAAAKLLAYAKSLECASAGATLSTFVKKFQGAEIAAALTEGARLSDYRFDKYKSKPAPKNRPADFLIITKDTKTEKEAAAAIANAEILMQGVYFTRDIANEPPNIMTPVFLAAAAEKMAKENGLICTVLGLKEIEKLKMGGVLGVSQGSSHPPRFVILENKVKNPKFAKPIVLVGKGVTFDTGGISIKPSGDMDKMKFDMCGAAAVMGAMKVIANLKLPIQVVGITPLVENMPGSTAQRPGDIIRCLNGKTVEVLNTDAEGRLILADALSYAERFKPKALIDIATLTGACSVTFHDLASGLMSTDSDLAKRIQKAGERTGERCWELPLWEEYGDLIRATYADIQNISKKYAGTITAGMFLKEFADHTVSWAHLDIAGTAWNDGGAKPLSPIGATGMGVRLFVEVIKSYLA